MDRLNTVLGVITVVVGLYMAAAWWRIWRREKPWRRRHAPRIQMIERATLSAPHGMHERQGRRSGRLHLDR
jgi:hypothetical protein